MESGYLACQLSWTPVMTTALYGASYLQTQTNLLCIKAGTVFLSVRIRIHVHIENEDLFKH
jgi:hypothetical protein